MSRNRLQTIEALRRLAARPGTKHEGETASRMLDRMVKNNFAPKPFSLESFPLGSAVFYNYWAYPQNCPCIVCEGRGHTRAKVIQSQTWMRLRFAHLKQPRWVPVTSERGCHISLVPLSEQDAHEMYHFWR
jgi:hypothetical protein